MSKLTGKTRYRTQRSWFGRERLVLQVEYHTETWHDLGGSGYFDIDRGTEWRDATTADLVTSVVVEAAP